jgi:xanthine dehydrogenase small subunit
MAGPTGRRTIPLSEFFTGYRKTAVRSGELLTAIEVPAPLPRFVRFYKISKRRLDDISTVAAGMALDLDGTGTVRRARFAFGGMAATPLRAVAAEETVEGQAWDADAVSRARTSLAGTVRPIGDHRGSRDFRLAVGRRLFDKFWWEWSQ